jgi:hypothetical protein
MKAIHMITFILVIVGALNWGAIGIFNWGIGDVLGDSIARIVYILVGLAAVYELFTHKSTCKMCNAGSSM